MLMTGTEIDDVIAWCRKDWVDRVAHRSSLRAQIGPGQERADRDRDRAGTARITVSDAPPNRSRPVAELLR